MIALSNTVAKENEAILAHVEALGGGYVWEPEIFTITLIDIPANDAEVAVLSQLQGVEQIALNCSNLSFGTIESIASIAGLCSLVLAHAALAPGQLQHLRRIVPEVLVVANEA